MESFPDQLRRQQKYFAKLFKMSNQLISKYTQVVKLQSQMAQTLEEFSLEEMSYNRAHLKAFSGILSQQANTTTLALPQLQSFMLCFNCSEEINLMKSLVNAQQKSLPPFNKEINAQFVQNAAVYQQNRQRSLRNAMLNISNFFMARGAQYVQDAANARLQSQQISDLAPVVDVARKFAHLEMNCDVAQLLKLTKQQFNEFDINAVAAVNQQIYRRGAQMPPASQKPSTKPKNSIGTLKSGIQQSQTQKADKQDIFQDQGPKMQLQSQIQPKNDQVVQNQSIKQQQIQNTYITNSLVNKFLDDDEQPIYNQPQVQQPKQPAQKQPNPLIKQYSFSNSLFDEESDHLEKQFPQKEPADVENNAPAVQKAIQKEQNLNIDYTQMVSKDLQQQMDEMRRMMSQLTDQPTSATDQPVKQPLNKQPAPKPLKPVPTREQQNDAFKNQIAKAIQQQEEIQEAEQPIKDEIDDFEM